MARCSHLLALLSASVAIATPLQLTSTVNHAPKATSSFIESLAANPSGTRDTSAEAFPSASTVSNPVGSVEPGRLDLDLTYGLIGDETIHWDDSTGSDLFEEIYLADLDASSVSLTIDEPDATPAPTLSLVASALEKRDYPETTECPSVELQLQTATSVTFIATETSTDSETLTYTEYPATVTVISQSVASGYVYEYAATVTSIARPTTRYVVSIEAAETTVTVPAPAGFTPVLCQADYLNPTTTSVMTSYTTAYEQPAVTVVAEEPLVFYGVEYTSTELITLSYDSTSTVRVYPTSTISSVRADPTQTIYAACASNNVNPYAPDGGFLLAAISQPGTIENVVPAADAVDCCGLCQADERCAASAFTTAGDVVCYHYLKDPASNSTSICNATFKAARGVGSWDERPAAYISNTGCGQYVLPRAGLIN